MAALKGKALIAYLVVCVFWGSTYLAIKVGVMELPPFLFAGLRFLVAGLLLLAIARALGDPLPRRSDWRTLAIVGLMLLVAIGMYPDLVVATDAKHSLTAYNAVSTPGTLKTMLIIALIGMPMVVSYTVVVYWVFRGKVKLEATSY